MKSKLLLLLLALTGYVKAQNCNPSSSIVFLDTNNVRALIRGGGDIWRGAFMGNVCYEVPKGSGNLSMYAGSLWLGGLDAGGNLHFAAQTYRQTGNDFWPGPIDSNLTSSIQNCDLFDRHWKVSRNQILAHIANPSNPDVSIAEWPAKGNTIGGQLINRNMAPFVDVNNNGIYDPLNGDYPRINGDQAIWWIYNDVGNVHTESGARALGVEVQVMAYSFATNDILNNTTLYDYVISNKSDTTYHDFYLGVWSDGDIGDYIDDVIGFDSIRNAAIYYNSGDFDFSYEYDIPVVAQAIIKTPKENNLSVQMKYGGFFRNDFTSQGNPVNSTHYYNYLTGFWKDNSPWGYNHAYTGSPCDSNQISMIHPVELNPSDFRTIQSFGPFTLTPGHCLDLTVAVITTFNSVYPNPCFDQIQASIDSVVMLHLNLTDDIMSCANATLSLPVNRSENYIHLYPNPVADEAIIESKGIDMEVICVYSSLGELVWQNRLPNKTKQHRLNTTHLPAGIYFISVAGENKLHTLKMVKY